ncbi:MAG: PVC-type heme-binding CxxCH protein, partial [Verrucomicrobiota bacterium]
MKRGYLLLFLALFSVSFAQESADFPTPYNSEADSTASPMPAEESVKKFQLPEGFEVTVFASEPEVQNPISMSWDHRGRLWVAENYTYARKGVRIASDLRDRVVIFEDTDWDGKADKRTVFTDKVQVLTSVAVGHGGVWLMCSPQLLFIPDANEDDIPDGPPQVMLDGFVLPEGNYHNFANGLKWGPDGWLYGRIGHSCPGKIGAPGTPENERIPVHGGIWRFHPSTHQFEMLTHGTVNPWGHDWDKHGQLFHINTVIGHLWHAIPGAYFRESGGAGPNPFTYSRIDQHADHYHFDTTGRWQESRDGAANSFGGGHAHIGMEIYQADHLPNYWRDKLLTWNLHGRRLNVERLERKGAGYVGRHEPDQFISGDEWFRGIEISTGPDGALYGIDWNDTGERLDRLFNVRWQGRFHSRIMVVEQRPRAPVSTLQCTHHGNQVIVANAFKITDGVLPGLRIRLISNLAHQIVGKRFAALGAWMLLAGLASTCCSRPRNRYKARTA